MDSHVFISHQQGVAEMLIDPVCHFESHSHFIRTRDNEIRFFCLGADIATVQSPEVFGKQGLVWSLSLDAECGQQKENYEYEPFHHSTMPSGMNAE